MDKRPNNMPQPSRRDVQSVQDLLTDDDEQVLYVIKQHIFGLLVIYIGVSVMLLALLSIVAISWPGIVGDLPGNSQALLFAALAFAIGITVFILLVATYIYNETRLIITDKHIIQVIQSGLFSRKTSRLALGNTEDITAEQHGIFATVLNFGTLYVETAGEQKNFKFAYCPRPNDCAEAVLDTRKAYIDEMNAVMPRRLA